MEIASNLWRTPRSGGDGEFLTARFLPDWSRQTFPHMGMGRVDVTAL